MVAPLLDRLRPRARVLVVDDDDSTREIIAELLRDEGYEAACAENEVAAFAERFEPNSRRTFFFSI